MLSILKKIIVLVLKLPESPLKKLIREIFYGEVVSERIVEYPLVFSFLDYKGEKENRKILDVGCYYSNLPIQLASMGFRVVGVDLQDYQLSHPNFRFIKGDIRTVKIREKFDIVTSISTLEHIGLGFYGDGKQVTGDRAAIGSIMKLLKPKGRLIITVPFGKKAQTPSYRSYDWDSIVELLDGFRIKRALCFMSKRGKWLPVSIMDAQKIDNRKNVKGMIFILTEKR